MKDDVIMGRIPGPVWSNECHHDEDCYIGSFDYLGKGYDVYVFGTRVEQSVCIRYGDEASEYYSPGSISEFLRNCRNLEVYESAYRVIKSEGGFIYRRNV